MASHEYKMSVEKLKQKTKAHNDQFKDLTAVTRFTERITKEKQREDQD